MEFALPIILGFIVLLVTAMVYATGFWSATILYFNTLIAALLATNWYEPLGEALYGQVKALGYWWDFLAFWTLFLVTLIVMRIGAGMISKVRVRFHKYLEMGGAIVMGLAVGGVMVNVIGFSLHLSPISREVFPELNPETLVSVRRIPARSWLQIMHFQSHGGALDRMSEDVQNFEAQEFVLRNQARRRAFEREK